MRCLSITGFPPAQQYHLPHLKKKWDRVSCLKKQSNVTSHHHVKKVVSDSLLPVDFAVSDWARLSAVASVISILEKNRIIYHPAGFVITGCAWFSSVQVPDQMLNKQICLRFFLRMWRSKWKLLQKFPWEQRYHFWSLDLFFFLLIFGLVSCLIAILNRLNSIIWLWDQ